MRFFKLKADNPNVEKMKAKRDVKKLIKAMNDKDFKVRRDAVLALGEIGDTKALEPLFQVLENDGTSDVRKSAVIALREIGKPAIELLVQALQVQHSDVRYLAGAVLGKMEWEPKSDVEKAWYLVTGSIYQWEELVKIGEPAVEPLIRELKKHPRSAARALRKINDSRAVEPLIQALTNYDDETEETREAIVDALAKIGEPAVEGLIQAIKDNIKDKDSGCGLRSTRVLYAAIGVLDEVGKTAVEPLIQALKDEDPDVREIVAGALEEMGWKPKNDIEKTLYLAAKGE